MRPRKPLFTLFTLVLAGSIQLVGCDRKPKAPPIEGSAAVGQWLEIDPSEYGDIRLQAAEPLEFHRHVVINADGTFEFNLLKRTGDPYSSKSITGTWDVDVQKNEVVFTVTTNQFDQGSEEHKWAPAKSRGVRKDTLKNEGQVDAISIVDSLGAPVRYKRTK